MQDEQIKNQLVLRNIASLDTASGITTVVPPNSNRRALILCANASLAYPAMALNNWYSAFIYRGSNATLSQQIYYVTPYLSPILRIEDFGEVITQRMLIQWNVDIIDYQYVVNELYLTDPTGAMLQPLT